MDTSGGVGRAHCVQSRREVARVHGNQEETDQPGTRIAESVYDSMADQRLEFLVHGVWSLDPRHHQEEPNPEGMARRLALPVLEHEAGRSAIERDSNPSFDMPGFHALPRHCR
jgi:hypothetical protein